MAVQTLEQFLAKAGSLTTVQRTTLIDQALVFMQDLYVHLPLKKAMYAIDPVQRLRNLRTRCAALSERQFHDEMIATFTSVRDLHTNYMLPNPYAGKVAFLPFLLEEYTDPDPGSTGRYVVTKLFAGLTASAFGPGAEVTHWNGAPIARAVEAEADRQPGSNLDARHARGLESMTIRDMTQRTPPDERWVIVTFVPVGGSEPKEIRLNWQVFAPDPAPGAVDPNNASSPAAQVLGYDASTEARRRAKKALFNPAAMRAEEAAAGGSAAADVSTMPDVFTFKTVETPAGTFGYLRIWTFFVSDDEAFLNELIAILAKLPTTGLIIDVRGNGGGNLYCSERALQLFTPEPVEPTLLSFLATPLTARLCGSADGALLGLQRWRESLDRAAQIGAPYSASLPLGGQDTYNSLGQHYQGPVVLIVDPLCYSATDMFAAGFRDNTLGPILGTAGNTGAGGANVWTHDLFRQVFAGNGFPFRALPKNAAMRVAIRRTTRQGTSGGMPIEDLGIVPDAIHRMTLDDVLESNVDLIEAAAEMLAALPVRTLALEPAAVIDAKLPLMLTTEGLDRVDLDLDGRPVASVDVSDGSSTAEIPFDGSAKRLDARGYHLGAVVVRTATDL